MNIVKLLYNIFKFFYFYLNNVLEIEIHFYLKFDDENL